MTERPSLVVQPARVDVFFLPRGTTLEQLHAKLTEGLLSAHKLHSANAPQIRDGAFPGQRYLHLSFEAPDIHDRFGDGWGGSADIHLEHVEEHDAPAARIHVSGYSGFVHEDEAARDARAAFRLAEAVTDAFRVAHGKPEEE